MAYHKCVTWKVRLLYVKGLREMSAPKGSDNLRYNVNVLIDKNDTLTIESLRGAYNKALDDGQKNLPQWNGKIPFGVSFENFLRDKSLESDNEIWEGNYVIVPKSKWKPKIIDIENNIVDPHNMEKLYDGCYARVSINVFPYAHTAGGKGIGLQFNSIKLLPGGHKVELQYDVSKDYEDDFIDDFEANNKEEPVKKLRKQ